MDQFLRQGPLSPTKYNPITDKDQTPTQHPDSHSCPRHMKQAPTLARTLTIGATTAIILRTSGPIPPARKIKEGRPKLNHPQYQPPPTQATYQHPGPTFIKSVVPRGRYSHNTGNPLTNSSGKYPYTPYRIPSPDKDNPPHSTPRHSYLTQKTKHAPQPATTLALGETMSRI